MCFFQDTCEIIREGVYGKVKVLFYGAGLPRIVTQTNLVLIPNKVMVNIFSYLRPIFWETLWIKSS